MRSGVSIVAGLLAGVLVAVGVLAALVFVGPDPVGLRPTPPPSAQPSPSPVASASASASLSPSPAASASASLGPSGSPAASAGASTSPSEALQAGFDVGQPEPPLAVPQLGGDVMAAGLTKILGVTVMP